MLPCGAGKTRAPLPLLRNLFSKRERGVVRILVLAPGLQLLAQILTEWLDHWKELTRLPMPDVLTVCSNPNVHDRKQKNHKTQKDENADDYEYNSIDKRQRKRLHRVTNRKEDIAKHVEKSSPGGVEPRVCLLLSTYQSSHIVRDGCVDLREDCCFDFAMFDEAHRTVQSDTTKGPSCYQIALHDSGKRNGINIRRRLFLTATPRCPKLASTDDVDGDGDFIVSTMDNLSTHGPHWELKEKDAILDEGNGKLGIVLPKKVIVGVVRRDACEDTLRRLVRQCDDDTGRAEDLLKIAALDRVADDIAKEQRGVSALSFHPKVDDAKDFKERLEKASIELSRNTDTKWSVGHVNADTSIADRNAELKQMADRRTNLKEKARGLVTNVRALGEGINAEDINLVVLDVNMRSAVSLGQAAGRATRIEDANPQKKVGYVLVLVMLAERDVADLRHDIDDCESQPEPSTSTNRTPRDAPTFDIGPDSASRAPHIDRLRRCGWKISNKGGVKTVPREAEALYRDQHPRLKSSTPIKVTLQEAILLQNELDARGENPDSNAMRDDDDDKEDDEKTFTRTRGTTTNSLSTFEHVKSVLRALAEANPDMQVALNDARSAAGRPSALESARKALSRYVEVRDVTPCGDESSRSTKAHEARDQHPRVSLDEMKELVRLKVERICTTDWDKMYGLLLQWLDDPECGKGEHCNVPKDAPIYKKENLYKWLEHQRKLQRSRGGQG